MVNRGAAYSDGKIFYNTLDGQTVAVDAATGKEVWNTQARRHQQGRDDDHGAAGGEGQGAGRQQRRRVRRPRLARRRSTPATGKIAWQAYSTGPDKDVLIGPGFKPFYAQDRGKDLGVTTWPPDAWKIGGGTVWGWISYDPELNLIYYGTGNPGPWNAEQRPGDNKWTCGIFARDADTGEARWFYQMSPHDLLRLRRRQREHAARPRRSTGERRKVLVHPERNGYVYVIDRATGEVLSADAVRLHQHRQRAST